MTSRRTTPAPQVEQLEDRTTPAVWGNPWPDPQHLTLSFAPDGTDIGGSASTLFAELGSGASSAWQLEILRAFQTWAAFGNINLSLTADSGDPFGAIGPAQGSSLYGDIRIGARPLAPSELAVGTPFDQFGTWSGEVLLNSNYAFSWTGQPWTRDLYTVVLQEAGHVFGLPDNNWNLSSVMYSYYMGPRMGLSWGDIFALQQLYGVRTPDQFDQAKPNDTLQTATAIRFVTDANALQGINPTSPGNTYVANGDITTGFDKDYYRFTAPAETSDFFVQLRTSGVSLLQARVSVYDLSGRLIQSTAATDPRSGDLSLHLTGVQPGGTYFVRVESAVANPFGIGSYRLAVGTDAHAAVFPPNQPLISPDGHGNDFWGTATNMGVTKADGTAAWDLTVRASIEDGEDRDVYKFKTSSLTGGALVLSVWATDPGRLNPVVRVYDSNGTLLPTEVLATDGVYYSVQVRNTPANAVLFVEVAAANPSGTQAAGNYFLAVDHRSEPIEIDHLASGTLTDSNRQEAFAFNLTRDHLFHFTLSAESMSGVEAAVRMTILDDRNRLIATIVADAGTTTTLDILLAAGNYRVVISGGTRDRTQSLSGLAYTLNGVICNDPIGPEAEDTTTAPVQTQPTTTTTYYYISPTTSSWFSWLDPYSDPWFGL